MYALVLRGWSVFLSFSDLICPRPFWTSAVANSPQAKHGLIWFFGLPGSSLRKGAIESLLGGFPKISTEFKPNDQSSQMLLFFLGLCETDELAEIVGFFNKLDSPFGRFRYTYRPYKSSKIHHQGLDYSYLQPLMCDRKFAKEIDLRLVRISEDPLRCLSLHSFTSFNHGYHGWCKR